MLARILAPEACVTFSDASVSFSSLLCQTPFAELLLRQGEFHLGL